MPTPLAIPSAEPVETELGVGWSALARARERAGVARHACPGWRYSLGPLKGPGSADIRGLEHKASALKQASLATARGGCLLTLVGQASPAAGDGAAWVSPKVAAWSRPCRAHRWRPDLHARVPDGPV